VAADGKQKHPRRRLYGDGMDRGAGGGGVIKRRGNQSRVFKDAAIRVTQEGDK